MCKKAGLSSKKLKVDRSENSYRGIHRAAIMEVISSDAIFVGNRTEVPKMSNCIHIGMPRAPQLYFSHKRRAQFCIFIPTK